MNITVAQVISKYRKKYNFSLEQISQKISISKELLRFIESGEYQFYPVSREVEDALKRLCYIFHLDYQQIHDMYRAEAKNSVSVTLPQIWKKSFQHLSITNQIIRYSLIGGLGVGIGGYMISQGLFFIQSPQITLASHNQDFQYTTNSYHVIEGHVSSGSQLTLNGQPVELDSEGKFRVEIGLSTKENAVELRLSRDQSQISSKQMIIYRQ